MAFLLDQHVLLGLSNANVAVGHSQRAEGVFPSIAVATWIGAFATALLGIYATHALIKQRRESRRAQAERVFAQVQELGGKYSVFVANTSDRPIYDVGVTISGHHGTTMHYERELPDVISHLMPSEKIEVPREGPTEVADGFSPGEISAAIRFRDAAGHRWHTTDRGELREIG
jgi:hypothetical protein